MAAASVEASSVVCSQQNHTAQVHETPASPEHVVVTCDDVTSDKDTPSSAKSWKAHNPLYFRDFWPQRVTRRSLICDCVLETFE